MGRKREGFWALAAVLDGVSREEAAKLGGMDRQTLRDWVIRFNEQGPDGLINIPSPGAPPKLDDMHKAFLRRIVDEGPIPAVHGVVRWRASDLIMRLHEEFGLSVSDDTIYRALKDLGFSHVSARPCCPLATPRPCKLHLDEIATKVTPGAHAILILDQAGWHGAKDLEAPKTSRSCRCRRVHQELNPQDGSLCGRAGCRTASSNPSTKSSTRYAWNALIDQPWKIMSIARRDWAVAGHSL
jgi:transposase